MEQFETRGAANRGRTDSISRVVAEAVVSREPITESQLRCLVPIISALVRKRFELSPIAARQAVEPVLRRLIPVTPNPKMGIRVVR